MSNHSSLSDISEKSFGSLSPSSDTEVIVGKSLREALHRETLDFRPSIEMTDQNVAQNLEGAIGESSTPDELFIEEAEKKLIEDKLCPLGKHYRQLAESLTKDNTTLVDEVSRLKLISCEAKDVAASVTGHYKSLQQRLVLAEDELTQLKGSKTEVNSMKAAQLPQAIGQEQTEAQEAQSVKPKTKALSTGPQTLSSSETTPSYNIPNPLYQQSVRKHYSLKPADILPLEDKDLYGMDATAKISLWCLSIESSWDNSHDRLMIARSRMTGRVQQVVGSMIVSGMIREWEDLKKYIMIDMADKGDPKQAWAIMNKFEYDGIEEPRAFVNSVKMQYELLKSKFPNQYFPNVDSFIKRKMMLNMPQGFQKSMEDYIALDVPFSEFLTNFQQKKVAMEDQFLDNNLVAPVVRQPTVAHVADQTNQYSSTLEALLASVQELARKLDNPTSKRRQSVKFCPFCLEKGHWLRDCPREPPVGLCFDCFGDDHLRGDKKCPGKVTRGKPQMNA